MSICSCGFATKCRDKFCEHLANGWEDFRVVHNNISQSH